MVFYFKSEGYVIYVGIDKYENEELIKYGFPEDIWFHVDKHSSAHVYLRLPKGENIHAIPATVLEDCAQLVKANSITGNKINNINVVYTPWSNLKKTGDMAVGQVGFHKQREQVLSVKVEKRSNEIVNRLNKTKEERMPDLQAEREERDRVEREAAKKVTREKKEKEKEEARQREKEAEIRSYSSLMTTSNMRSNAEVHSDDSDDFM